MNLQINAHNLKLTPKLQTYVEKKTARLDRYMPIAAVNIDLSEQNARKTTERQVAQITVRDKRGTILRAEERGGDIFASVDLVMDKIYRQISRYKGKQQKRRKAGGIDEFAMLEPVPVEVPAEEREPVLVRRKQFSLQPMPLDEAIDQMELLGHDFFVFFSTEDDNVNVLYKRRDGDYGVLQPDVLEDE